MEPRPPELNDTYLDAVLIGGREERAVVLVDYDPTWSLRFEEHRKRILNALGERARTVEHVASTAVPGLAAKPIVDIMVTVDDPNDEPGYLAALTQAGYELRVRENNHRMFRTPGQNVHVHVWQAGGEDEQRHLVFRDHLRSSPDDPQAYELLNR